jgi:hypothetical protein
MIAMTKEMVAITIKIHAIPNKIVFLIKDTCDLVKEIPVLVMETPPVSTRLGQKCLFSGYGSGVLAASAMQQENTGRGARGSAGMLRSDLAKGN